MQDGKNTQLNTGTGGIRLNLARPPLGTSPTSAGTVRPEYLQPLLLTHHAKNLRIAVVRDHPNADFTDNPRTMAPANDPDGHGTGTSQVTPRCSPPRAACRRNHSSGRSSGFSAVGRAEGAGLRAYKLSAARKQLNTLRSLSKTRLDTARCEGGEDAVPGHGLQPLCSGAE